MDILGDFEDRRQSARTHVLKSGSVLTVDGTQRVACVIDNVSETGALLIVEQPEYLPEDVVLMIDGENSKRPAHVTRRDHNTVAVKFVTRETADQTGSDWVFPPASTSR